MKEKHLLRRLMRYYHSYKKDVAIIFAASVITVITGLLFPIGMKYALDRMGLYDSLQSAAKDIVIISITFLIGAIGEIVYDRIKCYNSSKLYANIILDMKMDFMKKLHRLSIGWHSDHHSGELITIMDGDSDYSSHLISDILPESLNKIIVFVTSIFLFIYICPYMIIAISIPLAMMILYNLVIAPKILLKMKKVRQYVSKQNAFAEDCVAGIETTTAFNLKYYMLDKFSLLGNDIRDAVCEKWYAIYKNRVVEDVLENIIYWVFLITGIVLSANGKAKIADIALLYGYFYRIIEPVIWFSDVIAQYSKCMASFSRITEVMDAEEDISEPDEEHHEWTYGKSLGDIVFDNVYFKYRDEFILNHLSFHVQKGDFIAIVGESGNGKSTIAKLIPRYYDICGGSIRINGIDIRNFSLGALRQAVGVVSQDPYIYDGTILDNIKCVYSSCSMEKVWSAIKKANLEDFVSGLPDGINTVVGERGIKLSGGQKQRIAIARIFLYNPPIMIFDEATSSLDTISEKEIQNTLEEMQGEGKTVIVIAHRLSTIINADKIYVLGKNGDVVEKGVHNVLLKKNGEYARLYRVSSLN